MRRISGFSPGRVAIDSLVGFTPFERPHWIRLDKLNPAPIRRRQLCSGNLCLAVDCRNGERTMYRQDFRVTGTYHALGDRANMYPCLAMTLFAFCLRLLNLGRIPHMVCSATSLGSSADAVSSRD